MKLNFRHLFVIMPVSVEFIFMHMQNTYEDYMTKIQQLSILYQTNHSEFFFLDIRFDHSVLPATRACIKRFFSWTPIHFWLSFKFYIQLNRLSKSHIATSCIVLYKIHFFQEKKNGFIRFGNPHHVIIWRWTVIDIFSKPRHSLTARVITISFEPINTVLNCNELSNEWFYLRFSTFHV